MPDETRPGFYDEDEIGVATLDQRRAQARDAVLTADQILLTWSDGTATTHWGHIHGSEEEARSFILYALVRAIGDFKSAFDLSPAELSTYLLAAAQAGQMLDLVELIGEANARHQDEDLEGEFND